MKGIMKIQLMNYLRQLQEIQTTLAEEGVTTQLHVDMYDEELWTIVFFVHKNEQRNCTILYIWSPRLSTSKELYNNERKLSELRNRYVKKALAVV